MGIDKKTKVINDAVAAISQLYGGTAGLGQAKEEALRAVSYTHLTLPTKA